MSKGICLKSFRRQGCNCVVCPPPSIVLKLVLLYHCCWGVLNPNLRRSIKVVTLPLTTNWVSTFVDSDKIQKQAYNLVITPIMEILQILNVKWAMNEQRSIPFVCHKHFYR